MPNPKIACRPRRWAIAIGAAVLAYSLAAAADAPAGKLVWSDDFNQTPGSTPDHTKWAYDTGNWGWGNNELEMYTSAPANASIVADTAALDHRALAIKALKTDDGYTSGRLKTQGHFTLTHGRIEGRIKLPAGQGLWPAFWMLGDSIAKVGWPKCGEIDIMEVKGSKMNVLYGTMHGPGYSGSNGIGSTYALTPPANFGDGYHVFAVEWRTDRVDWYVDGHLYHTVVPSKLPAGAPWVFNQSPFFILLNLAVGGDWVSSPDSTTEFPATMYVDYVRVYDLP
jgi:beta-glucanase (GH16 family)